MQLSEQVYKDGLRLWPMNFIALTLSLFFIFAFPWYTFENDETYKTIGYTFVLATSIF